MGRDWKYWGSGSGSGKSNNNNHGSTTTTTTTTTKKKARPHIQSSHAAAGTGCINAVFQLFDFHHFQSSSTSHFWHQTVPSFKHLSEDQLEPSTTLKGAEAPRNSLEMMDPPIESSSSLTNSTTLLIMNPEPPLTNIHPMRIRVPNRTEDLSSECSSSPGAKTPNLVARLMGLDLLPQTSPRSSSCSSTYSSATNSSFKTRHYHLNSAVKDSKTPTQPRPNHAKFFLDTEFLGSRSLPETPRISSERRSEVDFHRLSLQSNRENSSGPMEELIELSRKSTGRRDLRVLEEEENRSPAFYARQIVKQVKDNINRKVGSDITNTVRNSRQSDQKQRDHGGVDDHIVLLKSKKPESRSTGDQDFASSNCSPRLRFLELKNRGANSQLSQTSKSSTQTHETMSDVGTTSKHHSSVPKEEKKQSSDQKCREMGKEIRRDQRLCLSSPNRSQPSDPIKNKKEETFFRSKLGRKKEKPPDKKCKKTPLSSELLSSNNVTNLFHVKRDPPSPLTKLPQKQEYNDARSSERRSVQEKTSTFQQTARRDGSGTRLILYPGNVGNRSWGLHDYVRRITAGSTNVTGLYGSVDPAVFHRLEAEVSSLKLFEGSASVPINMSLRCNRLLVFDSVNEFLGIEHSRKEMLKRGADLAETMCEKIKNFEAADCRVLEDIDAIIERDLRGAGREERKMRIGEDDERERIMEEIQRQLIEKLLEETTSLLRYYSN